MSRHHRHGNGAGGGVRFNTLFPLATLGIILGIILASRGFENSTIVNHGQDYTASTVGTVSDIERYDEYMSRKHPDSNPPVSDTYIVFVDFEVEGKQYTSDNYMKKSLASGYSNGQSVDIRYNPDDPNQSGMEKYVKSGSIIGNICLGSGLLLILASIVLGIKQAIGLLHQIKDAVGQVYICV